MLVGSKSPSSTHRSCFSVKFTKLSLTTALPFLWYSIGTSPRQINKFSPVELNFFSQSQPKQQHPFDSAQGTMAGQSFPEPSFGHNSIENGRTHLLMCSFMLYPEFVNVAK